MNENPTWREDTVLQDKIKKMLDAAKKLQEELHKQAERDVEALKNMLEIHAKRRGGDHHG